MNELVTIIKNEEDDTNIKYCIIFNEFPQCMVFVHNADVIDIANILENKSFNRSYLELYSIKDMNDDFFYMLHINDTFTCTLVKCNVQKYIGAGIENSIIDTTDLGKEYGYEIINKFEEIIKLSDE